MTERTSLAGWVVSEGTLRSQDLLPAFLRALEAVDPDAYQKVPHIHALKDEGAKWWDSEECAWFVSDVADAIDSACPDGLVFGAHEDDGACFGFWAEDAE
jgi:hypothetical protein